METIELSENQIMEFVDLQNRGIYKIHNGRKYYKITVFEKPRSPLNKIEFENFILNGSKEISKYKKRIYKSFRTTEYSLDKFLLEHYDTRDLREVKDIIYKSHINC
jgi:hypothetical protein